MKIKIGKPGKPGATLPWGQDDQGGWFRVLAGSDRVVALVDKYPPDLGDDFFYCVGDGDHEESSGHFETLDEAKAAADTRLVAMGYSFRGFD